MAYKNLEEEKAYRAYYEKHIRSEASKMKNEGVYYDRRHVEQK